jgi:hypothetical protein
MVSTSRQVMVIVLLLMLFQFFAPSLFRVDVQEILNPKQSVYQVQDSSIPAPLFLKEKDEKEQKITSIGRNQPQLLDLAVHSINLEASHSDPTYYFHSETLYETCPQLFTYNCTFLI